MFPEIWYYYRNVEEMVEVQQLVASRTKLLAWFVTKCQTESSREKYVEELNLYLKVDSYGECKTKKIMPKVVVGDFHDDNFP